MVISLDIDGALQLEQMQNFVRIIQQLRMGTAGGYNILSIAFVTARQKEEWEYDYQFKLFLDQFGMTVRDVYFANNKHELLNEIGSQMHFDSDASFVLELNSVSPGRGVLVHGKYDMQVID